MKSPLKTAIVYDLETGGFSPTFNSITEIAMVAVDLETLTIVDEMSTLIKPRIDLSNMLEDAEKEAKDIYKRIGTKDEQTGIKTLYLGEQKITLKNIQPLVEAVEEWQEFIESEFKTRILNYDDITYLLGTDKKDIMQVYLDNAYNPQALEATKISLKLISEEGLHYEEAFKKVYDFIRAHKSGNNKPIMCGHNIGWLPRRIRAGKEVAPNGFDNPFMEVFFKNNKKDFFYEINEIIWDTIPMARTKFKDLSSYALGSVAKALGITLKEAHRALPDTKANAHVLIKMLQSLRGDGGEGTKYEREKFTMNY